MGRYYCILFAFLSFVSFAQVDPYLSSKGVYKNGQLAKMNTQTINELNDLIQDSLYINTPMAERYARVNFQLAQNIEYAKGQVDAFLNMSRAKLYMNQTDSALLYAKMGHSIAEKNALNPSIVKSLEMIGTCYTYMQDYDKAVRQYFKAIQLAETVDKKLALSSYANIGHVYKKLNNLPKARSYSEKSYRLALRYKDSSVLVSACNNLGLVEKHEKKYEKALAYFEEGLAIARKTNDDRRQSEILHNMSNIYFEKKEYDIGFELFNESIELSKKNSNYTATAIAYHGLAFNYHTVNENKKAMAAAEKSLEYALLSNNYEIIMEAYAMHAQMAYENNQLEDAFAYLTYAYVYKDSMNLSSLNNAVVSAESKYEEEKKRLADSLDKVHTELKIASEKKVADQKLRSRELLLWISLAMLVFVSCGLYFLLKNNRLIKKQNLLVQQQKEEIQEQHREITDSIRYAQRIQQAIISKETEWQKISPEHFIFFQPKDVVSGDFYWAYTNVEKGLDIWAVADCTGHGVPGAFMSMLGIGLLNEIVMENQQVNPAEILNQLRKKIIATLSEEHDAKAMDGMDIALCVWNKKNRTLSYSGANSPLYLIRNTQLEKPENATREFTQPAAKHTLYEFAPNKMPIGYLHPSPPPFQAVEMEVMTHDVVVLFTDGYADQFGGEHGKKWKYKSFKEELLQGISQPMSSQGVQLEKAFHAWKGGHEQLDDVCVVGVKITG